MTDFDILNFQKETNEKINTFIMEIRIDLIKKISTKYKLDEKSVLRDFINNNWKNIESKKKTEITTKKELNKSLQCYAKVYGNKRCSRNCKDKKNYCGTHLKQLKDYGELKNGSFPIEEESENDEQESEDDEQESEDDEHEKDKDETKESESEKEIDDSASSVEELELNLVELISGLKVYVDLKTNDVYDINEDSNEIIGKLSSDNISEDDDDEYIEEDDENQFIIYNEDFLVKCKINKKNNEIYNNDKIFMGILQKNNSIVYDSNFIKLNNKKF
jgi:hypothetical protein